MAEGGGNAMSTLGDLKEQLAIHVESLHLDARGQPQLAEQAGELAAEAKAAAKRARLEADEVKADVQRDTRARPEAHGIDKITEGAVAAAVTTDAAVREIERAAIGAQEAADKAEAVANAYEHRRSMIKIEAELWLANYFSDVTVQEREMGQTGDQMKASQFERGQGRRRRRGEETEDGDSNGE